VRSRSYMRNRMRPIHPGEILREDFMKPMRIHASKLAAAPLVPPNRITAILAGTRSITADTALRLSRALGTSAELWMNLQRSYDLRRVELDRSSDAGTVRKKRRATLLARRLPPTAITSKGRP
jgi:addiction module HigA family antidote